MDKRCKECGKSFGALLGSQLYCGECRGTKRYYEGKPVTRKECFLCGKTFPTARPAQRFCSDRCRLEHYSIGIRKWKTCRNCHRVFMTTTNRRAYCGEACYLEAKRERDRKGRPKGADR